MKRPRGSVIIAMLAVAITTTPSLGEQAQKVQQSGSPSVQHAGLPTPAPELEQLKFFIGRWRCNGKQSASPSEPERAFKATFEVRGVST